MTCISRTASHPLTDNQRAQLLGMLRAAAISRETAKQIDKLPMAAIGGAGALHANTLVIGALRGKGLADSRSVREHGRSWTEYWLLDDGVRMAERVAAESAAEARHVAFLARFVGRGWIHWVRENADEQAAVDYGLRRRWLRQVLEEGHFTPAGQQALGAGA
jgi:hypothetical protein